MTEKNKGGRPPQSVPLDKADSLVEWISGGQMLAAWCREYNIGVTTVYDWMYKDPEFSDRVARARELGADSIADQSLGIVDEEPERGADGKVDPGWVQHQKLKAEHRLKLITKINPRKWGDSHKVEHSGSIGIEQMIASAGEE